MQLTDAEYLAVQGQVEVMARAVTGIDPEALEAFIRRAEHVDTIAPFVDPTGWIAGRDRLAMVIDHARALATFRRSVAPQASADPGDHHVGIGR